MNIIQCQFCKKPFASVGGRVCPACMDQIEKDFIKVRDYIYDHKQTNIDIVSEETEVPKQIIMHLLKEGRLELDGPGGGGGGVLFCESCKKPISSGRLCKECMGAIASSLDKNVSAPKKVEKAAAETQNLRGTAKIGQK